MTSKSEHQGRRIEVSIETSASAEQLWEAWTDPEKFSHWFSDRATGKPEVGSTFTWTFDSFGSMDYEVVAAELHQRFALGAKPPGGGPGSLLEVLIEKNDGTTSLKLVNSGISDGDEGEEGYEGCASGWLMALAALKYYVENHFGRPRASFVSMRPADYAYRDLKEYFRTGAGLARWLTKSGIIGPVGSPYEVRLKDGSTMSGRVLCATRRGEVLLSWTELEGIIELKGFKMGPGPRILCVRGCGWGLSAERAKSVEQSMDAAVERLATALG